MKIKCRPNAAKVRKFRESWKNFYGFHCAYCTVDCSDHPTIDHLVPRSKGGGNSIDNLVMACFACNQNKGDKIIKPILSPLERY